MFENLKDIDEHLFLWGNSFHSTFFDALMPYLTSFWIWIPLFLWWLLAFIRVFKTKTLFVVLFVVTLLALSDRSSVFVKNTFKRYRPSHNIRIKDKIHIVNEYRGGQYGYVSSHASNAFGIALFLCLLLKNRPQKWLKISFFVWAFIMMYTRIYLGVHYPFDLVSGALLGSLWALVLYKIFTMFNSLKPLP